MGAHNTGVSGASWPYEPTGSTGFTRGQLEQRPMACKLPAGDSTGRVKMLRREFIPGILDVEEIEDGYVYWFRRNEAELGKVADFALFASECCDFLDFGIGLNTCGDRISLRISGPRGAVNFLQLAMKGDIPSLGKAESESKE